MRKHVCRGDPLVYVRLTLKSLAVDVDKEEEVKIIVPKLLFPYPAGVFIKIAESERFNCLSKKESSDDLEFILSSP